MFVQRNLSKHAQLIASTTAKHAVVEEHNNAATDLKIKTIFSTDHIQNYPKVYLIVVDMDLNPVPGLYFHTRLGAPACNSKAGSKMLKAKAI